MATCQDWSDSGGSSSLSNYAEVSANDLAESASVETSNTVCMVKTRNVHDYTVPSFPVITVRLRQRTIQCEEGADGEIKYLDVFFREDDSLTHVFLPVEVYVEESCFVNVSSSCYLIEFSPIKY